MACRNRLCEVTNFNISCNNNESKFGSIKKIFQTLTAKSCGCKKATFQRRNFVLKHCPNFSVLVVLYLQDCCYDTGWNGFFLGLKQPAKWNFTAFFCSLWSLLLLWAWEHIPLPVRRSQPPTWRPDCSFLMTWCLWRTRWLRPRRKEASQDSAPQLTEFLQALWMLKANRGKLLNAPASEKVGGRLLVGVLDTDGLAPAPSRFGGQVWGASDQKPFKECVTLQLWGIIHALVHLSLQCFTATRQHSSLCDFPGHFFPLVWTNIQFKNCISDRGHI